MVVPQATTLTVSVIDPTVAAQLNAVTEGTFIACGGNAASVTAFHSRAQAKPSRADAWGYAGSMKPQMLIGAILTAIGIIGLAVGGGIHYVSREKIPHDGSTQLTARREKIISIPPTLGGLALAGGIVLMVLAARK